MAKATIIADSLSPQGHRITSMILEYPRIVHAEFMTHRLFSRNAASSRAVPSKKMVEEVKNNPFIPIAWQKDHSGMQGTEYFNESQSKYLVRKWLIGRDKAVQRAKDLDLVGVSKQLCNRLLEPFMNYKVLVTATEFDNFFKLRCPQYKMVNDSGVVTHYRSKKDYLEDLSTTDYNQSIKWSTLDWLKINDSQAEIHIQALAEAMWDAMNESTPKQLKAGEWHIPFSEDLKIPTKKFGETNYFYIHGNCIYEQKYKGNYFQLTNGDVEMTKSEEELIKLQCTKIDYKYSDEIKIKIATARCARISYLNFEGKDDYEADIKLFDRLKAMEHASPFEHCAIAMSNDEYETFNSGQLTKIVVENEYWESFDLLESNNNTKGWCRNFRGFIQLRHQLNF